ncbi:MAG: CRTAC1 family protein [Phycisphaerales bacterium]
MSPMRELTPAVVVAALAGAAPAGPAFVDVAAESGLLSVFDPADGYPGVHWHMAGGGAVADFNNDGWPDVFLPAGGNAPDRLFINQGPDASGFVTFEEQTAAWGCDLAHRSGGCAVGDVNRDGYVDLFVMSMGRTPFPAAISANVLYLNNGPDNNGDWSFTDVSQTSGVRGVHTTLDGMGAAFGDYDLDGDLDLALCHWYDIPGSVRLLTNDGTGSFSETITLPPHADREINGFQPRFADLNGDRYPELIVTGDFDTSAVWFNSGPDASGAITFDLRVEEAGLGKDCNAMGSALADFNNDLLLDWYITNIFYDVAGTCGNTLYLCQGINENNTPVFAEVGQTRGVREGGWGWGTTPLDLDHDGDLDLAATGGWFTWQPVPSRLFINDGAANFTDRARTAGTDFTGNGRGYVSLDYDNDGDLDLLLIANEGTARLYENQTPEAGTNHWLRVDLTTITNPCLAPGGFGTHVYVTAGGVTQKRHIDGAESYLSVGQRTAHFGLGGHAMADRVEIRYADGSTTVLTGVPADQILEVTAYHPADLTRDGAFTLDDVDPFVAAFLASDAAADLNADGVLDFDDIDALVAALSGNACD